MSVQVQKSQDTFKIICQKCQHFIRVTKITAEQYEDDPESFHCELCYVEPGKPIRLRTLINCATCTQTYDSKSSCLCPPKTSTITITYDPKGVWMKHNKVNEQQEADKTNRQFNKLIRNRKLEAEQRQIRVDTNLEKTVELLGKLVEQKEKKGAV